MCLIQPGRCSYPCATVAINVARNPLQEFIFNKGTPNKRHVFSPDIGRSAITGVTDLDDTTASNFNAYQIPVTGHP